MNESPRIDWDPWRTLLTEQMATWREKLTDIIAKQDTAKAEKDEASFVKLYLEYASIEREITDRQHVLELIHDPANFESDFYQADFFSYLVAAETIGLDLVDDITTEMRIAVVREFSEYETFDEFHAPYKNFILPGKILAGHFDDLDAVIDDMNHYIMQIVLEYDRSKSLEVLPYAFGLAIDADVNVELFLKGLHEGDWVWLRPEDREATIKAAFDEIAERESKKIKDENVARKYAREGLQN